MRNALIKIKKGMIKQRKKITMEDLAGMVQRGFSEATKNTNGRFDKMENEMRILHDNNIRDHEAILLRLDNVAYRFELVELQKRVEALEKKAGIKGE